MRDKNAIDKENALAILSVFWKFAKKHRRELVTSLICIPLNIVLMFTVVPWLISRVIEQLALQNNHSVTTYIIWIIICTILGLVFNYIGYGANFKHQASTYGDIVRSCFDSLAHRGEQFYANQFTGALTKYSVDFPMSYSNIEILVVSSMLPLVVRAISGIVLVSLAGAPFLALLLLVLVSATIYFLYSTRRKRQAIRIPRRDASTAINSHLADMVTNNQTMRTFAWWEGEARTNQKLVSTWHKLMDEDFRLLNLHFNRVLLINFSIQIVFIITLVMLVKSGSIGIAIAVFSASYITRFATEVLSVGGIINQFENALIDAAPMMKILQEAPEVIDTKNAAKLVVSNGRLEFKSVQFSYSDTPDQAVLPRLSLAVEPGEKIGLVGPSGGGKTTITKLLLRLLDIQTGEILIDNQNIAHVTQASLRQSIAYVPQDPLLFHRSLAENIGYASPEATLEDIKSAAKKAHAHEFISQLPDGYDTLVGERGVKLSGGQRQRVAIARAILKNSPIIVLDEATSALDSESEALIQDALGKLMKGRTVIVIAHRLSTIQKMDRIVVLEDGQITEQGNHKTLLTNKGTYAKLWAHQSGGFLEE